MKCPDCETTLDVDEEQAELGDEVVCEGCGESFEVVETDPIELEAIGAEDEEELDELDDFDEDEDEDDEEEDELLIGPNGESE